MNNSTFLIGLLLLPLAGLLANATPNALKHETDDVRCPGVESIQVAQRVYRDPTAVAGLVRHVLLHDDWEGLAGLVHPQKGLRLMAIGEMGDVIPDKHTQQWLVSDLHKKLLPEDLRRLLEKSKEYLLAQKEPKLWAGDPSSATGTYFIFMIRDGHHVGNYRGFQLTLERFEDVWKLSDISFPFDYTP